MKKKILFSRIDELTIKMVFVGLYNGQHLLFDGIEFHTLTEISSIKDIEIYKSLDFRISKNLAIEEFSSTNDVYIVKFSNGVTISILIQANLIGEPQQVVQIL